MLLNNIATESIVINFLPHVRFIKSIVALTVAVLFSLLAINNITDFETNHATVMTALSMDTIQSTHVKWRAVLNCDFIKTSYILIIFWETLVAALCWIGAIGMLFCRKDFSSYSKAKSIALIAITGAFILFMAGFLTVGNEWFYIWQSDLKSLQIKALLFSILMMACILFIAPESNEQTILRRK